ncbi:MAG TPA: hypothetical protein VN260_04680 [Dissulfurispiraceae bacterium]|nr:hypothetical protein [Dissulfurispiraceae bacterium]
MALEKVAERDRELMTLLRKWKSIEDTTIKSCEKILGKAKNPIVVTFVTSIKNDSEKHKALIQYIIDAQTKKGYVLAPEELKDVAALLNKHVELEQKSIEIATEAIEKSRGETKLLLKTILEDEKRHKKLAQLMEEQKLLVVARTT